MFHLNKLSKICIVAILFIAFGACSTASIASPLGEAKKLFKDGNYKQAKETLQLVVTLEPKNAEAHYFLGDTLSRLENIDGSRIPQTEWASVEAISNELEKALALEPDYQGEIILLNPRDKIMSEWSTLALRYLSENKIDMAKKAFYEAKKRGGIDPAEQELMKNSLLSCPKQALLLTSGDMDTFHSLYLQICEGFRPDVLVLNVWLLNVQWYFKLIRENHPWAMTPIRLSHGDKDFFKLDEDIPSPGCNRPATIHIKVPAAFEGKFVPIHEGAILDILLNNPERPFCCSGTVDLPQYMDHTWKDGKKWDIKADLVQFGLVRQLTMCKDTLASVKTTEELFEDKYTYACIPNSPKINRYALFNIYLEFCVTAAMKLEALGEHQRSKALLKIFAEKVPGIKFLDNKQQRDLILSATR
jgi:hypothetical protein